MKTNYLALVTALILSACSTSTKNNGHSASATPSALSDQKVLWTIKDSNIQNPESVYYDSESKFIFVSNVAGQATAKDKKGWISKVDARTGKIIKAKWISGLNAPKGLRASHGVLWVSDIDQLVSINIKKGKILKKIKIAGAQFLNDTAIGPQGEVYVSDMATATIHVIKNNKPEVFVKDTEMELPNGLLIQGNSLYVASWGIGMQPDFSTKEAGRLISYDLNSKAKTVVSKKGFGNLDGIESDGNGNFFISDWIAGKVYFVNAHGEPSLILQGTQGTADLGYIAESNVLMIPNMQQSTIVAYSLK